MNKNAFTVFTYLRLHVKCPTFLSNFNKIWSYRQIFHKSPNIKFDGNRSSGSHADTGGETDGHDEGNRLLSRLTIRQELQRFHEKSLKFPPVFRFVSAYRMRLGVGLSSSVSRGLRRCLFRSCFLSTTLCARGSVAGQTNYCKVVRSVPCSDQYSQFTEPTKCTLKMVHWDRNMSERYM